MSHSRMEGRRGSIHVVALTGAAAIALSALAGAAHSPAAGSERRIRSDSVPTFATDVAPIIYRSCGSCHRPGGIGPFSLLDYDSASKHLKDIGRAVRSGYMPPWHAEAPYGTFMNDRRLAAADKRTIARWIAAGAPLGDATALPPKPVFTDGWEIGKPDVVLAMGEDYDVPAHGTVEYQYFEVPTNFTEDKWVQAIEIRPGAREVVHHVLVFARAPQAALRPAESTGTPGGGAPAAVPRPKPVLVFDANNKIDDKPRTDLAHPAPRNVGSLIGGTAPGTNVLRFPAGTALKIRAGSVLVFQMHYTARGHAMKDRSSVGFIFAPQPPSEQVFATHFFNAQFTLPAGEKNVMVPSTLGFNEGVKVYGLFPHTHLRGVRWQYTLEKPDGTSEVILDVPHYDFNWQTYYLFSTPLQVAGGSRIVAKAWYDNSAENPDNPDPTIAVHWGDQTWEEMQYTGILYSVDSRRLAPAGK